MKRLVTSVSKHGSESYHEFCAFYNEVEMETVTSCSPSVADSMGTSSGVVLLEASRASIINSNARDHDVRKMLTLANKKTLFEILGGETVRI